MEITRAFIAYFLLALRAALTAFKDRRWRVQLWLAEHGWYRYHGSLRCMPRSWPMGKVVYDDNTESFPMALGSAVDYARMFDGRVVKADNDQ